MAKKETKPLKPCHCEERSNRTAKSNHKGLKAKRAQGVMLSDSRSTERLSADRQAKTNRATQQPTSQSMSLNEAIARRRAATKGCPK